MAKEYVIWGVPPGEVDEQILYTLAKSMDEANAVMKVLATKHGATAMHVQVIDLSQPVNFGKMFAGTINRGGRRSRETGADDEDDGPRIKVSYEIIHPSEEDVYPEIENGWVNEDGVPIEPDEDETIAEAAAKMMKYDGATEASSSHFHTGIWYTSYGDTDYQSGETENRSYHLYGFTPEEEAEVFELMKPRRR